MHSLSRLWGTWTLNQYLFSRLLWDTNTDVDALLDEYFRLYYPTTSEHTREFYEYLEAALANVKTFKHGVDIAGDGLYLLRRRLANKDEELLFTEHLHYEAYHPAKNDGPDFVEMISGMQLARKEIDAALMLCSDKDEQLRLLEDEHRFAYGEAMVSFYYHIVRTALFYRKDNDALARNEFSYVERFADILREVTDLVHVSSNDANARNGFEATQDAIKAYDFFKEKYGKP